MAAPVAIELLLVPQCPHADAARRLLAQCLAEAQVDVAVVERVGDFPSPTILVDGRDVVTGDEAMTGVSACRLDLPTGAQIHRALRRATRPVDAAPHTDVGDSPAQPAAGVPGIRSLP
ncbi:hypothetical protein [Dactylosporangium darangshiense]|uniref:Alkylmercury lyase n=1 Tax=Dactylosporangium darangshiense TaxID=579108 RepID=A0ABP8DUH9_9ACTN